MHTQNAHAHLQARHAVEGSLEKKYACFYKKSNGIYGTKTSSYTSIQFWILEGLLRFKNKLQSDLRIESLSVS